MSADLIRGLYDYHRWANRRLFDVAAAVGEDLLSRDVGEQFSYPTIRRMFGHLYGADRLWLTRWTGGTLATLPGPEFTTLAAIRAPWDDVEREQRAYIESLSAADYERVIQYTGAEGKQFRAHSGPCSSTCRITPRTTGARSRPCSRWSAARPRTAGSRPTFSRRRTSCTRRKKRPGESGRT